MSDASDTNRYAAVETRRNVAVPRALLVFGVIAGLILLGVLINGFVRRFVSPPEQPDRTPASQLQVSGPAPLQMPQDVTAPAREAPHAVAPAAAPPAPAPAPTKTVAQRVEESIGVSKERPVLMLPDKDWDKVGEARSGIAGALNQPPSEADQAAVAFGKKPQAPALAGSRATAVADMTRTIRPGTRLFCTTQEAVDTTTGAGDFVCDVDYWVQAWDGATPLIPPHSWATVHYEELKNGRNRIFAAAGILTTPDGVVVSLGDPFGMPDGSGGIEGVIQDNTWARLKEGLILDFAQSAFQTVENLAQRQNQGSNSSSLNFSLNTNNTQQSADAELQKNMNIPDILRLPQGAHISMTIMHPIFFQDVVSFTMRAGSR